MAILLPTGFRFYPKDEELVVYYLSRKINNQPLPCQIIKEVDLYRYEDPLELIANNESIGDLKEWYFFTKRTKVTKHQEGGYYTNRTTSKGFWKTSGSKSVKYEGVEVGLRMNLKFFYGTPAKKVKTNWLMNEFILGSNLKGGENSMKFNEWVLCKVYNHKECNDAINTQPGNSNEALILSTNGLPETVHDQSGSVMALNDELPAPTTCRPEDEALLLTSNNMCVDFHAPPISIPQEWIHDPNQQGSIGDEAHSQQMNNYMPVDFASTSNDFIIQFEPMSINDNLQSAPSGEYLEFSFPPTSFNTMEGYQNYNMAISEEQTQEMSNNNGVIQNQLENAKNCSSEQSTWYMPQFMLAEDNAEFPATGFNSMGEEDDGTSIFI